LGLWFHGERRCTDCPLNECGFPKFTAWNLLMSAGIFPDTEDCGRAVHGWREVFSALAEYKGGLVGRTLVDVGLQSEKEHSESDNACKRGAEDLLAKLSPQSRCQGCRLWWCY